MGYHRDLPDETRVVMLRESANRHHTCRLCPIKYKHFPCSEHECSEKRETVWKERKRVNKENGKEESGKKESGKKESGKEESGKSFTDNFKISFAFIPNTP